MQDREGLEIAYGYALDSPDPSTQNGAFIVNANGLQVGSCNKFPNGVIATPERLERPLKYNYIEHAERNAIFASTRSGIALLGATMYVPWFACADCGRAIIQAGIRRVVGHKQMFDATPDHWKESIAHADAMLLEAGVETVLIDAKLGVSPIRFNGELWNP